MLAAAAAAIAFGEPEDIIGNDDLGPYLDDDAAIAWVMRGWATDALLDGYEQVRPLNGAELKSLPLLARGSALRFFLTRLVDLAATPKDALVSPKNPIEYVRRLRFHQGVRSIADYGLEEAVRKMTSAPAWAQTSLSRDSARGVMTSS